jgi:phospho-N-acetylmuramoyl-pentapeptide-transferase
MLRYLANFSDHFGPLRMLGYVTFRTLLAACTAALMGFVIG